MQALFTENSKSKETSRNDALIVRRSAFRSFSVEIEIKTTPTQRERDWMITWAPGEQQIVSYPLERGVTGDRNKGGEGRKWGIWKLITADVLWSLHIKIAHSKCLFRKCCAHIFINMYLHYYICVRDIHMDLNGHNEWMNICEWLEGWIHAKREGGPNWWRNTRIGLVRWEDRVIYVSEGTLFSSIKRIWAT